MSTIARFTLEEYDRLVATGALDKRRLELIRGEIREMSPIGPEHEDAVDELTDWSTQPSLKQKGSIEVHRDPQDGRYRSVQVYTGDEEIHPLAAPGAALRPSMLFGNGPASGSL